VYVHSKPTKIKKFRVTLRKATPPDTSHAGPYPYRFYMKPVSSEEVQDAWVRLLQPLGFSVNPSNFKSFLEPLPDESGKSQDTCWTDIQELNPEEAFQVNFGKLRLPLAGYLHYGFQVAARWSVETSSPDTKIPPPIGQPQIGPSLEPPFKKKSPWTKMRAEVALMVYERGDRGSWTVSTKDYNSTPVLAWIEKKITSELYSVAHPEK